MNKIEYDLKNKCGIYIITNIINGKRYIGSSNDLYRRLHHHWNHLKNNTHNNNILQNSWNKYTEDKFIYGILYFCEEEVLLEYEQHIINNLNPEFNIQKEVVGISGAIRPEETKRKISEGLKRNYESLGRLPARKNYDTIYVYDIINFKLVSICKDVNKASMLLYNNMHSLQTNNIKSRLVKNQYIVSNTKFNFLSDLKNYLSENILLYKGKHMDTTEYFKKYLIIEDNASNMYYFKGVPDAIKFLKCSSTSTFKKHSNARKDSPYFIPKTNYKMYFSNIFIPYVQNAVPIEESLELLQTNIGEDCDVNPEISIENKKSIPL